MGQRLFLGIVLSVQQGSGIVMESLDVGFRVLFVDGGRLSGSV